MSAGTDFRDRIQAEFDAPDAAQGLLLDQIVRLLDELEGMEATLEADGLTTTGGNGQLTSHPLLATSRQHRVAIAGIIAKLGIDTDDSPATRAARHAANKRWGNK